jgi:methionine-rich copper-binding protein CopC
MNTRSKIAATLGVAALTGVLTAVPAAAHTSLISAAPASGSAVRPPADIELTYGEPVRFVGVVVLDARGGHHESGRPRVVDAKVTQPVAGTLPNGAYTVGWRVVAPDGHPVSGRYRFTVEAGGASLTPATPTAASRQGGEPSRAGWWWVGLAALLLAGTAGGIARIRQGRTGTRS